MANILVVEDDFAVRSFVSLILQRDGHSVCVASTAEEAEGTCADFHADILVADIALPGKSGIDLAGTLLRSQPHARILFVTGWPIQRVSDSKNLRNMQHGSYAFLQKPFSPGVLSSTVWELLGRKTTTGVTVGRAVGNDR